MTGVQTCALPICFPVTILHVFAGFFLCFLVVGLCCVVLCVGVVCFFVLWCFVFSTRRVCVFLCFVLWCGIFVLVARCDGLLVRLGGYDECFV